jgi:hypothetical protein
MVCHKQVWAKGVQGFKGSRIRVIGNPDDIGSESVSNAILEFKNFGEIETRIKFQIATP